jgi:hypothetical protein
LEILVTEIARDGTGTKNKKFNSMFTKYMGDKKDKKSGKELQSSINHLVDTVKAMNSKIASFTFTVRYNAGISGNAECASFRSVWNGQKLTVSEIQTMEDDVSFGKTQRGGSVMTIGPGTFTNSMYALDSQCVIETFLHELAHHAAGAIDDNSGGECYGLTGVNRLKAIGPDDAVRNAENVGFFCMNWVAAIK